tara:strand:- start:1651 stop:1827 length:177 start_codon:yes stop_codon:yes gene_type:complete
MPEVHTKKLHGYVNHLAMLDTGKTVKILGGEGLKLFVKDLDGNVEECYHNNLRLIWGK